MLAGIRETMGFNRQPYEQERFDRKSDRCRQDTLKAMYLWSYYSPGMMLIGSLGGAMVLWFGTAEVLQHRLSVGELVMFISYLALFYVPINQIHSVNHMLQHAWPQANGCSKCSISFRRSWIARTLVCRLLDYEERSRFISLHFIIERMCRS